MAKSVLPHSMKGYRIHLVGIKGTGMAALAEILLSRGAEITGSDVAEKFYTDRILQELGIAYKESFSEKTINRGIRLVIHSAAYNPSDNVELKAALSAGIPVISFPEALGDLSAQYDSSGISGIHGKTTTAAMAGILLKYLDLPATILVGSEVAAFGGRSSLVQGDHYFVAETCEYRRHFLYFFPRRLVITNIEPDHLDYYHDQEDLISAFTSYALNLSPKGALIYCADNAGALEAVKRVSRKRNDLKYIPYGLTAEGPYRLVEIKTVAGKTSFQLAGISRNFTMRIPGEHSALNAAAAIALVLEILKSERKEVIPSDWDKIGQALLDFTGSRRRSEVVGEARGVLFMDDYGHHPTEITKTLAGIKAFYPERRLVVDFMSHTYSRTKALLADFARSFGSADEVILHQIYASAREVKLPGISGEKLFQEVAKHHTRVKFFHRVLDALPYLTAGLKEGDLLITMGAGNNWELGKRLYEKFRGEIK